MNRMHLLFWISCVVEIGLIGAEANDDVSASTVQFRNFSPKNEVVFQYDRLTSTTSRLGFLVTEAQKETEAGDEAASWEKATAIRMLGKLHATDAVEILLNELAFFDIKSKTYPACFAVIDIGEPVVSNLLERARDIVKCCGWAACERILLNHSYAASFISPSMNGVPSITLSMS